MNFQVARSSVRSASASAPKTFRHFASLMNETEKDRIIR